MEKENKRLFIVSFWRDMWRKEIRDIFVADPFLRHLIERDDLLSQFDSVKFADVPTVDRQIFQGLVDYVREKCDLYVQVIGGRLNEIHGSSYGIEFWKKSFYLDLIRLITQFHCAFTQFETHFRPEKHSCSILAPSSYRIPHNFEECRKIFQSTHFGQEEMFSLYIHTFYPGMFPTVSPDLLPTEHPENVRLPAKKQNPLHTVFSLIRKHKQYFFWKCLAKAFSLISERTFRKKEPVEVGILDSFFAWEHVKRLESETRGKISRVRHTIDAVVGNTSAIDWGRRATLGAFEKGFDRFDRFFFSALPYSFPMAFVENFDAILHECGRFHTVYPKIHDIVCEAWLSKTCDSILLAFLKEKYKTSHRYNEHNAFMHQFAGDMVRMQASLVDTFVSMGWSDSAIENLRPGASLFPFAVPVAEEKEYDILYIDYPPEWKMSQYASVYSLADVFSLSVIKFVETFFENLCKTTLSSVTVRDYPKAYAIPFIRYDEEYLFSDWRQYMSFSEASYAAGETSKEQMAKSRLTIVSFSSTAYLEALHMNIPFIFFWDPEAKYTDDAYPDFYQPLVDAGICQTDPVLAAALVEKIKENPEVWWKSEKVQSGRKAFMEKNFNPPEVMIDYLKSLLRENQAA
jgi:putative transferase (TIGR04331 family)